MSAKKTHSSKAGKLRELSTSDIDLESSKSRQELLDLRIRNSTGQLAGENPLRIRSLRRNIARLAFVAAEKKRAAATAA
ncbi:MAG: 50S ribosomal protein L29 [Puniceicoccales bacterium]|jgi:ribosomal protein L29|nr:50S ribosomal protein L29 [Puniceicoccales bacterium]